MASAAQAATGLDWNHEIYQENLKRGSLRTEDCKNFKGETSIHIANMSAYPGSGFGTAAVREVVSESLKNGYEGRVHCVAAYSSHIFHLYMGMIPIEDHWVKTEFGLCGIWAIKSYQSIKEKLIAKTQLTDVESNNLTTLKRILSSAKQTFSALDNVLEIADQDVIDSEETLRKLENRTISCLTNSFIPTLLEILERQKFTRRPDTSAWGNVHLYLSDEGRNRWIEAIEGERAFVPFRRFEHLQPLMTQDQLKQLNSILDFRENVGK